MDKYGALDLKDIFVEESRTMQELLEENIKKLNYAENSSKDYAKIDYESISDNLDDIISKATKMKSKIKSDQERRNKIDGFFG